MNKNKSEDIISKIMASPYCESEESQKIAKALESLNDDDLEIVEEHTLLKIQGEPK